MISINYYLIILNYYSYYKCAISLIAILPETSSLQNRYRPCCWSVSTLPPFLRAFISVLDQLLLSNYSYHQAWLDSEVRLDLNSCSATIFVTSNKLAFLGQSLFSDS